MPVGADLDRWLGGEPVEAQAPSTIYRIEKFVRRNVLSVSLGAGAVAALVAVAAVAVVMGLQAREDSARAVAARDFMLNIFQRANQEKSRGADITARDLLETGRKDVLTRLAGQPKLQAELLRGIAKTQADMGEFVTADSTFAELERIYEALRQPREQAMARADHALNSLSMNDPASATHLLLSASATPGRPVGDAELNARISEVSGWLLLNEGKADRALELLLAARTAAVEALGENHLRTFRLGQALFRAERDGGRTQDALALQERLRQSAAAIPSLGLEEIAVMDWEHVNLLYGAGHFARALTLVESVRPKCISGLGPHAQPCRYLTIKRTQLLLRLGYTEKASEALPELRPIADDATLPFLQLEALMLALRLRSTKDENVSLKWEDVFERLRKFGESGKEVQVQASLKAGALLGLAESQLRAGDAVEARRWVESALHIMAIDERAPLRSRLAANAQTLLGIAWLEQGKADAALGSLERAERYLSETLGASHPATQLLMLNKAMALAASGRPSEALETVKGAESVLRVALGVETPAYKRILALRQRLELASGQAVPSETSSFQSPQQWQDWTQSARAFFNG